ncbi:MAG: tRNA (5-methylaminomethyl-2-thiouridine)(34)-methyltransferase MnmD [Cyclobacteriaceae bacterium]|nr:tRNA (5-methylaminomethyl-2-thiouridine)(34)-methyltransferase MnmD [Cyclobacteriaceae bacterium HetDA_MAG_MS6]
MDSKNLKIIKTDDGSHTLLNVALNETYHSWRGAMGESVQVFIESGLEYLYHEREKISILEIGFGTGLNAVLAYQFAQQRMVNLEFETLEPYPIPPEIYQQLNYFSDQPRWSKALQALHDHSWDVRHDFEHFQFLKRQETLESYQPEKNFDVIFFDAFAPSKQAAVWSLPNIQKCYRSLATGGILVTYCAQGQFKRNLLATGFEVESLPGAMGKKEMVRARKPS